MYDLIPHAPCPTSDPTRTTTEPTAAGALGSLQTQLTNKSMKKKNQLAAPASQPVPPPKTASPSAASTEVNAIQYSESLGGNKKGKNKSKKYDNEKEYKTQNPDVDSKNKRKEKFHCLIYGGDHFTKECPCREEVSKFLKNSPNPTVLKDHFPTQQQFIDHQSLHGPSSSFIDEVKNDVK